MKNKFKEESKTFLQTLTKNVSNSLHGGCIRKDIEGSYKCVTQSWMKNEDAETVVEGFLFKNVNNMVKTKDNEGVDDEGISKKNYFSTMQSRFFYDFSLKKNS